MVFIWITTMVYHNNTLLESRKVDYQVIEMVTKFQNSSKLITGMSNLVNHLAYRILEVRKLVYQLAPRQIINKKILTVYIK